MTIVVVVFGRTSVGVTEHSVHVSTNCSTVTAVGIEVPSALLPSWTKSYILGLTKSSAGVGGKAPMPEHSPAVCRFKAWVLAGLLLSGHFGAVPAQSPGTGTFDLNIEKRRLVADTSVIRVMQGVSVVLRWRSDEPVVLHLHGYDVETRVAPGATAETRFEAYAAGRYPVTIHASSNQPHGHGHHDTLLYIEIQPN